MFHFSNKQHWLRFCIDACCIVACYMTAIVVVRHQSLWPLRVYDVIFEFTLVAGWYYTGKTNSLYARNGNLYIELLKTSGAVIFQGIFIAVIYYIIEQPAYLGLFSLWYLPLLIVVLFAQKIFVNLVRIRKKSRKERTNVLIVGGGRLGMKFYDYVASHPASGYNIVGVLDDHEPSSRLNGHYLGKIDSLQEIFNSDLNVNEVVVALPYSDVKKMKRVISMAKNQAVHVKFMPDYAHFVSAGFTVETFGEILMVNPRPEPLESLHWRAVKRLFDICFSVLVLTLICSWLFPIVAIIIKLNSKGPVFFKQLRSGKNTIPFYCYKFRSMYLNDEAHLQRATKNDPRVTIVGRIIRKTNIDELPQFFNVLMGTMSVVGPRPHMVSQNRVYSKIISQYLVRQLIKPGVTGWAQVKGYRGETKTTADMQNRIGHDVWYLEHWTLGLDIKIIFLTVWNMIKGEDNAY